MKYKSMEYNSSKELLTMPEYGRNVQELINYAKTIEDPEYRQAFVERLLDLMHQMQPKNKNIEDYRAKLWKHLFRIAKYDIDVSPKNSPKPKEEDMLVKPDKVGYPKPDTRFRHYGHNVQRLIEKAIEMEPGAKRDGFINVIATYMKLAYKTWNKDHYVSDEVVRGDLKSLSDGQLIIDQSISLDSNIQSASHKRKKRSANSLNNSQHNNNKHKGSRNHRYKGRK